MDIPYVPVNANCLEPRISRAAPVELDADAGVLASPAEGRHNSKQTIFHRSKVRNC